MWFFLRDFFLALCLLLFRNNTRLDPPRLSPSSPSTLRATAAFRGFRRRRGCICVTCHQRWHIRAGPITGAQNLDQFSARGEGWGCWVSNMWSDYSMFVLTVWYGIMMYYDVLWCIMMHHYIMMYYYDVSWFTMIHCDWLWFIVIHQLMIFRCRFAKDISIYRLGCPPAQDASHHPAYYIF